MDSHKLLREVQRQLSSVNGLAEALREAEKNIFVFYNRNVKVAEKKCLTTNNLCTI